MLCLVTKSCPTLCNAVGCSPPNTLCLWAFSRQEYWSGFPCPPSGDLPNPGIECRSPALQMGSLPSEPPGKPKNTGVGGLCLLQEIFPTQELDQGLLHYRQILYQLSYQGYVSRFGKLSSIHMAGKGPFSLQSQRRAMPKNVQSTIQSYSFHMLGRLCSKSSKLGFSSKWTENFQMNKFQRGGETRE